METEFVDKPIEFKRLRKDRRSGTLRFVVSDAVESFYNADTFAEAFEMKQKHPGSFIGHVWVTNSPTK